jgi:putative Mg2+ transporter-C (MgtC) family protein
MPLTLGWSEIALRLVLATLAGAVIGLNRTEHNHPAGLRTTILVCLAAAFSMVQANLLLNTTGHNSSSFVVFDIMRLPLGILSGMGFIGAGAILRRGNRVQGVTTAATLWFVTVMGLCFGGGQIGLGLAALAASTVVIWYLKRLENLLPQHRRAVLILTSDPDGPGDDQIRQTLFAAHCQPGPWAVDQAPARFRRVRVEVSWRGHLKDIDPPILIAQLSQLPGIRRVTWRPIDAQSPGDFG